MPRDDWMPAREEELVQWFKNFAAKLPEYQVRLELGPIELITVTADAAMVVSSVNAVAIARVKLGEWVDFKNLELYGRDAEATPSLPPVPSWGAIDPVRPGIVRRTRELVARIKAHPSYNEQIADVLGLIGEEPEPVDDIRPAGSVKTLPVFQAEISFVKGRFDGVDIESQRRRATRWTHIAFDGFSPYIDNRPPMIVAEPEERRYRLRYRDNDVPVGEYSQTLKVLVGG